jgi:hypothetical protein
VINDCYEKLLKKLYKTLALAAIDLAKAAMVAGPLNLQEADLAI